MHECTLVSGIHRTICCPTQEAEENRWAVSVARSDSVAIRATTTSLALQKCSVWFVGRHLHAALAPYTYCTSSCDVCVSADIVGYKEREKERFIERIWLLWSSCQLVKKAVDLSPPCFHFPSLHPAAIEYHHVEIVPASARRARRGASTSLWKSESVQYLLPWQHCSGQKVLQLCHAMDHRGAETECCKDEICVAHTW